MMKQMRRHAVFFAVFITTIFFLGTFSAAAANIPTQEEAQLEMLNHINAEREKNGLNPLVMDETLTEIASEHAVDMIVRDYFSHWSPEKLSPGDRMRNADVPFRVMGENLAGNSSVSHAHSMLMNSPSHRANILNERFNKVGVSIIDGSKYGMMMVMKFTN